VKFPVKHSQSAELIGGGKDHSPICSLKVGSGVGGTTPVEHRKKVGFHPISVNHIYIYEETKKSEKPERTNTRARQGRAEGNNINRRKHRETNQHAFPIAFVPSFLSPVSSPPAVQPFLP
jgi:hypothetical protein